MAGLTDARSNRRRTRRLFIVTILVVLIGVPLVASWAVGKFATRLPGNSFDFDLASIVLTGLGTTLLAAVTGALAFSTWQDVRASQRAADAAEDQLSIARSEETRRPVLTLSADTEKVHSRVEGDHWPYIRLIVSNEAGKRASRGTRLLVDRSWKTHFERDTTITFGSPSLSWTSEWEGDGSVTVFAGSSRIVDLGYLVKRDVNGGRIDHNFPISQYPWTLKLGLHKLVLADGRDFLEPERWTIRVVLGADEVDGQAYDVDVYWPSKVETAETALGVLQVVVRPASLADGGAEATAS